MMLMFLTISLGMAGNETYRLLLFESVVCYSCLALASLRDDCCSGKESSWTDWKNFSMFDSTGHPV